MGNPDLSLKSGILDLAIEREMHKGFHPHRPPPPPPPRNSSPKSWLYGFPLYRSSSNSEKKTVKLFSWTVFFFCLLCVRVRDNCSVKNSSTVQIFSRIPAPPRPLPEKKGRKENQEQAYLRWNPFSDFASFDPNFKNQSPDFPIKYAGPSVFRS